jgi:hypothetical protein
LAEERRRAFRYGLLNTNNHEKPNPKTDELLAFAVFCAHWTVIAPAVPPGR